MAFPFDTVILLGPTAVGKTSLGVRLASEFGWEIISADSRQVYVGLDIGSGKDISEYTLSSGKQIPHHLIDVAELDREYNVFHFQQDFYSIYGKNLAEGKTSFIVGGTGMYVDSVARAAEYNFIPAPENAALREELEKLSLEELGGRLIRLKPELHNKSDLLIRERIVRAIEIEEYKLSPEGRAEQEKIAARILPKPLIIGTTLEREQMHANIGIRLDQRLEEGMIEEVESLHKKYSWERLEKLGLEYRFVSLYLEGKIASKEEMRENLYHAICQFAKRQETWFRGMERKGAKIHWLTKENDREKKFLQAREIILGNC